MANKYDVILGEYREEDTGGSGLINISDPDPTGQEGLMTINSVTNILKIFYGGIWQNLHVLTIPGIFSYYINETGDYYLTEGGDKYLLE